MPFWGSLGASLSLKHQVMSGARVALLAQSLLRALSFVITLALVRLLTPSDFGAFGMFVIVFRFFAMMIHNGFEQVLVQRKSLSSDESSSVFWFVTGVSATCAVLGIACSPALAAFFRRPDLARLSQAIALEIPLTGAAVVPLALLKRGLKFKALSAVNLVSTLAGLGVAVALALAHWGYWALVGQMLVTAGLRSVMGCQLAGWMPRAVLKRAALQPLVQSGNGILRYNLLNYWSRNGDNLLVGKFFGVADLGLYGRAYGILVLPIEYLLQGLGEIIYPALCQVQDDQVRFGRVYLKMIRLTAFILFPIYLGISAVSDDLVNVMWGSQWSRTAGLLRIFGLTGCLQVLCFPCGWVYLAMGRSAAMARWGFAGNSILILSILAGVASGSIEGLTWAYFLGAAAIFVPCQHYAMSIIGLGTKDVVAEAFRAAAIAALMSVMVRTVGVYLMQDWQPLPRLASLIGIGVLAYALGALFVCRQTVLDLLELAGMRKTAESVAQV